MTRLAIRCHPGGTASDEVQSWLEWQVDELRAAGPGATVRLSRLTPSGADGEPGVGWLVELELSDSEPRVGERLADAMRDMRLLGLAPTLLSPRDAASNGGAAGEGSV